MNYDLISPGSRRPSLASIHSSTSSARSYSARRLERERNEKEHRLALQELRLHRQREQQQQQQSAPTPSPRTPHSTDELLPSVDEVAEVWMPHTKYGQFRKIQCSPTLHPFSSKFHPISAFLHRSKMFWDVFCWKFHVESRYLDRFLVSDPWDQIFADILGHSLSWYVFPNFKSIKPRYWLLLVNF